MGHVPDEAYLSQLDSNLSSTEIALARIRQLSAHEVGHTLGFAHNFAASTYADRASVMDYPAPLTKIKDGMIDLSDAYGVGIGEWDKFIVQYAYSEFPPEQEERELADLITKAIAKKMLYVTDADARPAGAAHPLGNLWDNGSDPVAALRHEMNVRAIAVRDFGIKSLTQGQPLAELEKAFVPVYLHHRYQVDATAKVLGGYFYSYAVKGDEQIAQTPVPVDQQREALAELLKTVQPESLAIPLRILDMIPPRVGASASDRERFESQTSPIFDPASAIRTAAELTIGNLLQPQRASRLARTEAEKWGLFELLDEVVKATIESREPRSLAELEARRIVQSVLVEKLIILASSESASYDARAIAAARLRKIQAYFRRSLASTRLRAIEEAHFQLLGAEIGRFINRPAPEAQPAKAIELPPGSPIGDR
jgi:hypothetical protein